ncbi:MAG: hypothetical protein MJE66_20120, partial [Proteobacteria bacterium]|nr:hypothetical protein [Pseudomonadota bacterium]
AGMAQFADNALFFASVATFFPVLVAASYWWWARRKAAYAMLLAGAVAYGAGRLVSFLCPLTGIPASEADAVFASAATG